MKANRFFLIAEVTFFLCLVVWGICLEIRLSEIERKLNNRDGVAVQNVAGTMSTGDIRIVR